MASAESTWQAWHFRSELTTGLDEADSRKRACRRLTTTEAMLMDASPGHSAIDAALGISCFTVFSEAKRIGRQQEAFISAFVAKTATTRPTTFAVVPAICRTEPSRKTS
jgi:hypothetical protein